MSNWAFHLLPLDPLLFGDSRLGGSWFGRDADPSPLAFFGCVGAHLMELLDQPEPVLGKRVPDILARDEVPTARLLGALYREDSGRRWFPKPRHLRLKLRDGNLVALETMSPVEPTSVSSGPYPGVLSSDLQEEHEEPTFLSEEELGHLLRGGKRAFPQELTHAALLESEIFRRDGRAGIRRDPDTGLVEEGELFRRPYRAFRPEGASAEGCATGFECWWQLLADPGQDLEGTGFLGGDRRRVRISATPLDDQVPMLALMEEIAAEAGAAKGVFLYLLNPAIVGPEFPDWILHDRGGEDPSRIRPFAAATGRFSRLSGWNQKRRCPRPLVTTMPAGAVLFFRWQDLDVPPSAAGDWVREHWLGHLGGGEGNAGFGRVLVGLWREDHGPN